MKKVTRSRTRATRKSALDALPQDHLPPDSGRAAPTEPLEDVPPRDGIKATHVAQRTPGEAGVGVRPHLEGSEQGPQ
jgi:hypothetical protein